MCASATVALTSKTAPKNMKPTAIESKKRMGRPPILGGESVTATMRISVAQDTDFERAAKKDGKKKSAWMREVLEREAHRLLAA